MVKYAFCGDQDVADWLLAEIAVLSRIAQSLMSKDESIDLSAVKAALAALNSILLGAVKYGVEESVLSAELQQLGLPKENGDAVARGYRDNRDALREAASRDVLRLPSLVPGSVGWRVDRIIASSVQQEMEAPCVCLSFTTHTPGPAASGETLRIDLAKQKFDVLHAELRRASALMASLNPA